MPCATRQMTAEPSPPARTEESTGGRGKPPGTAFLPLGIGLILLVLMTILPSLATDAHGKADHPAALLIFWAMSAGFVRGVGFVPLHWLPRLLLSGYACALSLALALVRLYVIGRIDLYL